VEALLARARNEFGTHLADDVASGVAAQVLGAKGRSQDSPLLSIPQ
jgi:hypothetical protein